MRYADGDAMRMALEQRLRNEAAAQGVALVRLRKRVAFERFLARLAVSSVDWVLKGAFALELRLGLQTRMTKDVDLARDDDEAAVTRDLVAAAALDIEDFFTFRVRRTSALERAVGFRAVRYSVISELAGRRFERPRPITDANTVGLYREPSSDDLSERERFAKWRELGVAQTMRRSLRRAWRLAAEPENAILLFLRKRGSPVGLFKKASSEELEVREAESELIDLAGSVGQAVGRCATGEMPGDFLSAIIEAHSERMRESFAVVARSRGQEKTWNQTLKHARRIATTWTHDRIPASALTDPVADALRASLGTGDHSTS